MKVEENDTKGKRFVAIFDDGRRVHFGQANPKHGTYIDTGDEKARRNYIKRHEVNERRFYTDPRRPAT